MAGEEFQVVTVRQGSSNKRVVALLQEALDSGTWRYLADAGGSDEIMMNIIAERVLGLPQDIRVDKEVPFNEIPTGNK